MSDSREELRRDLGATVAARRELGRDYEAELVESFVERIDDTIKARVDAELAERRGPSAKPSDDQQPFVIAIISLGTGIPITAIAGGTADLPGIVAAWVGIVGVNAVFSLGRRRARGR
jgi:hypothetical protein